MNLLYQVTRHALERFKKSVIRFESCGYRTKNKIKTLKQRTKCRVHFVAPQIINNNNKSIVGIDSMDMLIALRPILFKSKRRYFRIVWRILDLMVISSSIIANFRLSSDENYYSSTSHGKFRLFHFKAEIAKFLLTKLNIQISPTATVNSSIDVYQSDEENESSTKKLLKVRCTVTNII